MAGLHALLQRAPPGTRATLQAFALAESLTDRTAERIYTIVPVEDLAFADFMSALRFSDLVEPRNSEWNLAAPARAALIEGDALSDERARAVHRLLLDAASSPDRGQAGIDTPSYLFTDAGLAYHHAAVGELEASLRHYARAAMRSYNGAQWLASQFAAEQERRHILPQGAIETTFLRAMVLFRTGQRERALPLLRQVAATDEARPEVAIALHIVANDGAHRRDPDAQSAYTRSIAIRREIGDPWGLAQTEHSLANLLTDEHRYPEAEALYLRSIAALRELGDKSGLARTEHSLANMYAKADRFPEAELAYKRSIEIDLDANDPWSAAQTEHSLANMYAKAGRDDEAERTYRQNLAARAELGDTLGLAQTEHSLGNLYARLGRPTEAVQSYERSIAIGESLRNTRHLAQVLHSYARLLESDSPPRALEMLRRSLELDTANGNHRGIEMMRRSIAALRQRTGL